LSDIDWAAARITIAQRKTGQVVAVPLLADVGDALADYLLRGRPDSGDDRVFLRARAPHVGFSPDCNLWPVAAKAFKAAGIEPSQGAGRGLRVFRASVATWMLQDGAPLPVISRALGHRGVEAAKHYLAVDEAGVRECCLGFEGIEPAGTHK
jgi:integrase